MTLIRYDNPVPEYAGLDWLGGRLPVEAESWPSMNAYSTIDGSDDAMSAMADEIHAYAAIKPWLWPGRPHLFFSDMHADADAFLRSLVASGGVAKTGPADGDMELTAFGRGACFVIGGDCFDKGPHNLRLLEVLKCLHERGADVVNLVGNHDLRTYVGIASAGARDPRHAHLFVRMGKKAVPLFKEIFDRYVAGSDRSWQQRSDADIREELFPDAGWYRDFPDAAKGVIPEAKIAKEMIRIAEKTREFEARTAKLGMTLGMVYAALEHARRLFLADNGTYAWFFRDMQLAHQAGSILMLHAGVDDQVAAMLKAGGVDALNGAFRSALKDDLFDLYNGPIGNAFRTKYRISDMPFTEQGLEDIHAAGIYAIMHGHRNLRAGQQITLRQGLLNFECDASVDSGTRRLEGLPGLGGAVTIVHPSARVFAISTDYPLIKDFRPSDFFHLTTIV